MKLLEREKGIEPSA